MHAVIKLQQRHAKIPSQESQFFPTDFKIWRTLIFHFLTYSSKGATSIHCGEHQFFPTDFKIWTKAEECRPWLSFSRARLKSPHGSVHFFSNIFQNLNNVRISADTSLNNQNNKQAKQNLHRRIYRILTWTNMAGRRGGGLRKMIKDFISWESFYF